VQGGGGRAMQQVRGVKQSHQKYFLTIEHKSDYDKVC